MGPSLCSGITVCLVVALAQVISVTCQEDTKKGVASAEHVLHVDLVCAFTPDALSCRNPPILVRAWDRHQGCPWWLGVATPVFPWQIKGSVVQNQRRCSRPELCILKMPETGTSNSPSTFLSPGVAPHVLPEIKACRKFYPKPNAPLLQFNPVVTSPGRRSTGNNKQRQQQRKRFVHKLGTIHHKQTPTCKIHGMSLSVPSKYELMQYFMQVHLLKESRLDTHVVAVLFHEDPCTHNGKTYSHNQIWSPEPCRICACNTGTVVCEEEVCEELGDCQTTEAPEGQCCPVCLTARQPPLYTDNKTAIKETSRSLMSVAVLFHEDSCTEDGKVYSNNQIWSPLPCQVCICETGTVVCEDVVCEDLSDCETSEIPEGECCAVCVAAAQRPIADTEADNCMENGKVYANNEMWSPELCRVCVCEEGTPVCEDVVCEDLGDCQKTVTPEGECCPVCLTAASASTPSTDPNTATSCFVSFSDEAAEEQKKGSCTVDGELHHHNDIWKPAPCRVCVCDDGVVICDEVQCEILSNCEKVVTPEGECCPVCDTFASAGRMIGGGEPRAFRTFCEFYSIFLTCVNLEMTWNAAGLQIVTLGGTKYVFVVGKHPVNLVDWSL
ncbi:Extracellular matrix protein FRAS1 Precursor [Channa argus]|uniref:Extracellular matrix protein FRAS1 n=1 Tax=Channa argus TaxID=215402 RepID=A0A6G1PE68_CHAAH|nr:Extracellular matrix protein FRAS1 Precursor [Channa argus]